MVPSARISTVVGRQRGPERRRSSGPADRWPGRRSRRCCSANGRPASMPSPLSTPTNATRSPYCWCTCSSAGISVRHGRAGRRPRSSRPSACRRSRPSVTGEPSKRVELGCRGRLTDEARRRRAAAGWSVPVGSVSVRVERRRRRRPRRRTSDELPVAWNAAMASTTMARAMANQTPRGRRRRAGRCSGARSSLGRVSIGRRNGPPTVPPGPALGRQRARPDRPGQPTASGWRAARGGCRTDRRRSAGRSRRGRPRSRTSWPAGLEPLGQGRQVVDQQRGVGLAGRSEVGLDAEVQLHAGGPRTSSRPARPGAGAWARW